MPGPESSLVKAILGVLCGEDTSCTDGTRRGSTDRSTVPYWCTIDVRTHTGPYGVPTGPPGAHRDPTDPWRTAGGTVGPRLIGASPVWAARSSYWRSRCNW